MEKSVVNVATAIWQAMQDCGGYLKKDKTVGEGTGAAYKGLSDRKVLSLRDSLIKNNLIMVCQDAVQEVRVDRWVEESEYKGKITVKHKQSVFTQVACKYLIIHTPSGESLQTASIGQGVDSQDKGAGKSMTYSKKIALLNALLVASGDEEETPILDTDSTHSESMEVPATTPQISPFAYAATEAGGVSKLFAQMLDDLRKMDTTTAELWQGKWNEATTNKAKREVCKELFNKL